MCVVATNPSTNMRLPIEQYKRLTSDFDNQDQIVTAMLQATKNSEKQARFTLVIKLLKTLKRKQIGTNSVEFGVNKTCSVLSDSAKMTIKMKIMTAKIADAYAKLREATFRKRRVWRESRRIIPGTLLAGYMHIWREHIERCKRLITAKHAKKIVWLEKRWKKMCAAVPEVVRSIRIADDDLPAEFESTPRIYGGVQIDEDERAALELSPKFGLFRQLNVEKGKIDVEESLNKLRWNSILGGRAGSKQGGGLGTAGQQGQGERDARGGQMFVDRVSNKVDVNKLRVTDLPYNPSVHMPGSLGGEVELRLHQVKVEVRDAVKKMLKKSHRWDNVSESEKRGLDKLCKRIKAKEIVCFVTDKSGRMSCDSLDNYRKACEAELADARKTPEITIDDHEEAEKAMNAEGLALLRMMGLKSGKSADRLRNAIVADGVKIPPFYGMRKDHKKVSIGKEEAGPRVRPVCGAEDCVTKRVSYILCLLLSPLIPEEGTHCWATDDLIAEFEKVNEEGSVDEDCVIGSLDVDALYPSLDIDRCARVVAGKLFDSDLRFEKLNWREIALYLRFHLSDEEIRAEGLEGVCPRRKTHLGRPPTFVSSGSAAGSDERYGPWFFPRRAPRGVEVRRMFCIAVRVMIVKTMSLHDFQLDGKIYRQSSGGSIGLDLTGVVSDIYMCEWDRLLMMKMEDDGFLIMLYKRYKDDVNFVVKCLVGLTIAEGQERDKAVVGRIKRLAESIDPHLKVSTDVCSAHDDGRLPILDLKTWIGRDQVGIVRILFSHYMKDVSSRAIMHLRSSHSDKMKFNVFVNEVLRILRNCSPHTVWEQEAARHVTYFMRRMQYSGHSEEMRYRVVSSALQRYDDKVSSGSLFSRHQDSERGADKQDWYKKNGKYDSVMFVEATPGSKLRKEVERIVRRHRVKIKVVERVGTTVKRTLQKSDPFSRRGCERHQCVVCDNGCDVDCRTRGVVYELWCKECMRKYRGQTGRSTYERTKEQVSSAGSDDKPLKRHRELYHGGDEVDVGCKILAQCFGKPSRRMISEAVYIDELKDSETMNSKREWSYAKLNKVIV